jgi:long-chain acyl-CoA synthetase
MENIDMAQLARLPDVDAPENEHPFFQDGQWLWEKNYPEGLSWHAPLLKKPLFHLLDQAAEKFPDNLFLDFGGKTTTFARAQREVNRIARGLQKIGVGRGVHVGLFLPNTPYAVLFHYGILKAGGTVVNYNPLYVERELASQIEDSKTDIMVTTDAPALYGKIEALRAKTRLQKIIICPMAGLLRFPKNILARAPKIPGDAQHIHYRKLVRNDGAVALPVIDVENDTAVLQYTGGTTGIPKGAMLTHANICANVEQLAHWMSQVAEPGREKIIGVLPFFHVFAMTVVMHCSARLGKKIIIHQKFDLPAMRESLRLHRPTFFPAVPAVFNAIANCSSVRREDFANLKYCVTGGAPMPSDVRRLFEEKTGCRALREAYGLTETSPGVTFNPALGPGKPDSVGLPLPQTIVDIINPDTGALLPPGEKGEVCVRGPQVMKGYYNRPDETAQVLQEGRLRTGDIGFIDDEGYLHLVDRLKDMIIVRGYNVYPRIVEEAIYLHPAVEECIVAGVPDSERGESVRAWVKPAAGKTLTESELVLFLRDKISAIERPRKIIIRDTPLPKTAVGKLSKKDLLVQEGIVRKV